MINTFGGNTIGKKTATAGTVINVLVPACKNAYTRVTKIKYTLFYPNNSSSGAEYSLVHSITALRPIGRTVLSAAAAASQAVINLKADPGAAINVLNALGLANLIAASDIVVIRQDDGSFVQATVSSVSGLATTLTGNLSYAISAGADVWFYGVIADTDPRTNQAHPIFRVPVAQAANVSEVFTDENAGVIASIGYDEPIILQSNNTVDAGNFDQVSYCFTKN